MARRKSSFKGFAILAGVLGLGAYFSAPIMKQVQHFIPSLHPAKK